MQTAQSFTINQATKTNRTTERTPNSATERPNTFSAIAEQHGVKPDTVRLRWFPYVEAVAPIEYLKQGKQLTEFAVKLLHDFGWNAGSSAEERQLWVESRQDFYTEHLNRTTERTQPNDRTAKANSEPNDRTEEGTVTVNALAVKTEVVNITPFDLGDLGEVKRLDLSAIEAQNDELDQVMGLLQDRLKSKIVGDFRAVGRMVGQQGVNAFKREVAQAYKEALGN